MIKNKNSKHIEVEAERWKQQSNDVGLIRSSGIEKGKLSPSNMHLNAEDFDIHYRDIPFENAESTTRRKHAPKGIWAEKLFNGSPATTDVMQPMSCNQVMHHMTMHIGQAKITPLIAISQSSVINTK